MVPDHARALFWDIDTATFDPRAYPEYTIGRILELGDLPDIEWMERVFTREEICAALRADRKLSRRSANYWALIYGLSPNELEAFRS